jgi:steroid 5-alpha reductase family enzyme
MKKNRSFGFAIIALIYLFAILAGLFVFRTASEFFSFYLSIFIADVAATLFVYLTGLFVKNTSVYDPYWSVQPIVIVLFLLTRFKVFNLGIILMLIALLYWGIRLTANWAHTFDSLEEQDWRYDMLKAKTGRLYPFVSLIGINLFPTVIVFLAIYPAIVFFEAGGFNFGTLIGFLTCITAATLQLFADIQMQKFRKEPHDKDQIIDVGLWKYSRHPNYLGEIMMWWGIFIMMFSVDTTQWILSIGALLNTMMFFFISIPMAEKRLARYKTGFTDYKKHTRMLLPFKKTIQ